MPHQADGPRDRWHLLRPLMQLLLTSVAPSNIERSGDTIIQTQNCVPPCAWVKLIFSVSRIVIFAQGGHALFTLNFPGNSICACHPCAGSHEFFTGKNDLICACHPCASHTSVSFKKKKTNSDLDCHSCAGAMQQYPESHHLCAGAMQQCPEEETPSSLRRGHATVSNGR